MHRRRAKKRQGYLFMNKIRVILLVIMLAACCGFGAVNDAVELRTENLDDGVCPESAADYDAVYQKLNQPILDLSFGESAIEIDHQEVFAFAESVKGNFLPVMDESGVFPPQLIYMLEETLYEALDENMKTFPWEENGDNPYFKLLEELGADSFRLNLEDLCRLFPNLSSEMEKTENSAEAYQLVTGSLKCFDMFYFCDASGEEFCVCLEDTGGSYGAVTVSLNCLKEGELVTISTFETQNSGYGAVIGYEDDFYYVYLPYNYNLKNYDRIRIHRLGPDAEHETVTIQYLPERYVWNNLYSSGSDSELEAYLESIRDEITSDKYLENGTAGEPELFWGDEAPDEEFPLTNGSIDQYYRIDFANMGIPVYIRKSNLIPSSYRDVWQLRIRFYLQDGNAGSVKELEKLQIGAYAAEKEKPRLVQLWFREIDGEVLTFRLYNLFDYNYMLNVILVEGDHVKQVRTDLFSPARSFTVKEGIVFQSF